jgi:uncharacterized membrane protein/predicted DsbA family dithiol-disulfide isomerase
MPSNTKFLLVGLSLAAMCGMMLSCYAIYLMLTPNSNNFCSLNSFINCGHIMNSKESVFFDIPVAWFGLCYYLWILSTATWVMFFKKKDHYLLLVGLLISLLATLFSFYKAWQMIFVLKSVCIICLGMYAAILLILFFFIRLTRSFLLSRFEGNRVRLSFYMHGLFSVLIVFCASYLIIRSGIIHASPVGTKNSKDQMQASGYRNQAEIVARHFMQPVKIFSFLENGEKAIKIPVTGPISAKISIIEFSDFECPYCKSAASVLDDILLEFGSSVKLYFMHYPLTGHRNANMAARAAIYAQNKGRFKDFHNDLFEQQESLNEDSIMKLSVKYGWDSSAFRRAILSDTMQNLLTKYIAYGKLAQVDGTPTIYINGRRVEQWQDLEAVRAIIQEEIQTAKTIN